MSKAAPVLQKGEQYKQLVNPLLMGINVPDDMKED